MLKIEDIINTVVCSDCMEVLKQLPDGCVNCCVSSPPYYGLRDYGTATWEGGDENCGHQIVSDDTAGEKQKSNNGSMRTYKETCKKCGAVRIDQQLGLEKTMEEYVAKMVEVFAEVKRVLKPEGTLWLNLGSSYSNGMSDVSDSLNYLLEGCGVIFFDSPSIAVSAKSVDISPMNQRTPQGVFSNLFCSQGESVKKRNDDFTEVLDFFTIPRNGISGISLALMPGNVTAPNTVQQVFDCSKIIFTDLNPNLKSELAVLGIAGTGTSKSNNTTLAVKETSKPRTKGGIRWHTSWDTFSFAAAAKGIPNINFMNNSISFRDGLLFFACLFGDFRVTQASDKQVTFKSIKSSFLFTITNISHLFFSINDGSIVPYSVLYDKAIRMSNKKSAKQEIDTPNIVKTALQEDGWICRQTIIWHKPNPMPESVTDRCTKSHEYIFLLSKNKKYYYDNEAIKEDSVDPESYTGRRQRGHTKLMKSSILGHDFDKLDGKVYEKRNKRSVWSVNTHSFSEAHFATFPEELITPCVLAGCPEDGIVLDPFGGVFTTALVAYKNRRNYIMIELNKNYCEMGEKRIQDEKEKFGLLENNPCIVPEPIVNLNKNSLFKK